MYSKTFSAAPSVQPHRWLPILLAISIFMQLLDATILNTALPKIAIDLQQSPLQMQSAIISYALTLALLMPLSGFLCDRFGTKKVFLVAISLFVIGSVLCAASQSLSMLVVARIVQGVGGAMLMPVPRLIVMRAYDKTQFLGVMNITIMPALIGPILGPLVGGYLVEYASWHWIFLINIPIGLAGLFMTWKIMPDFYAENGKKPHLDLSGFLLFGMAAVCLSLAVELLIHEATRTVASFCLAIGCAALYYYWKHALLQGDSALYPPQLRLMRTFRIGVLGNLFSRLGMASIPFLLPLLLQVAFGYSASLSGLMIAPMAVAAIIAKPIAKFWITQHGYRRVLIWNTRSIGSLIALLAWVHIETPLWVLIPLLLVLGMCNSIQYTAMNTLTVANLRAKYMSSGTSLMAVNQQLAIGFGIAIGALLLNGFSSSAEAQQNIHFAFRQTFIIIGSITFFASWIFARLHLRDGSSLIAKE